MNSKTKGGFMFKRIFAFIVFLFVMVATLLADSDLSLYPIDAISVADGVTVDNDVAVPGVTVTGTAEVEVLRDYDLRSDELDTDSGADLYADPSSFARNQDTGYWKMTRPAWPRHVLAENKKANSTGYIWSISERLAGSISTRD